MSANRLLGLRCKGSEKFAIVQIFRLKVLGLWFKGRGKLSKTYREHDREGIGIVRVLCVIYKRNRGSLS